MKQDYRRLLSCYISQEQCKGMEKSVLFFRKARRYKMKIAKKTVHVIVKVVTAVAAAIKVLREKE